MASPYIMQTGPLLVGSLLGFFLNGVFAMQLYYYFTNFARSDPRPFSYFVALVVVIEVLHVFFSTHTLYAILAVGFGSPSVLTNSPFSGAAMPALNGLVGLCTQIFFAWRIYRLRSNFLGKLATGFVVLTACLQCAAAFGVAVQFTMLSLDIHLLRTLKRTVIVWLAGSFICDTFISLTITSILSIERRSLSYTRSKRVVDRLIVHTIENGLITTICALVDLLTYLQLPDTFFYVCFEVLLGRLYANVLLAALNGRHRPEPTRAEELAFHFTFDSTKSHDDLDSVKRNSFPSSLPPLTAALGPENASRRGSATSKV